MKRSFVTFLLATSSFVGGCSTLGNSSLLGAGIGALAGTGFGLLVPAGRHDQFRGRNAVVGGALGGLLGGGTGYLVHEVISKSQKQTTELAKEVEPKTPPAYLGGTEQPILIPPRVETRFVDDQVRGNVFIPGHIEYNISEPARWTH